MTVATAIFYLRSSIFDPRSAIFYRQSSILNLRIAAKED